ncbi:sulfite exporter TauE/SafE family protein [Luteimonas terrae]|uniref:Probable membrane transporter protein n=1 Tax=Luteimonas terrae TaxID=1530191 RepID=A0ABU1XT02_9GAMM|nr:sulfite exporter TauE/SafE family protein [Luteimonas terrae]MDR7191860.1 putative membrane protein YfcA [Luteimonas terrae]
MLTWSMLCFPLLGAVAGVLAGLLGIGGGLVLVTALVWLLPLYGVPQDGAMHTALATALASIILTGLSSARAHHLRRSVLWPTVAWMVPGVLLGGWIGSWLAVRLDGDVLRYCVVAYCAVVGTQLLLSRTPPAGGDAVAPAGLGLSGAGVGIGVLSSIVGIGGGSMTVPLLVWRGVSPVRAVGTSSACGVFIAFAAAAGYALQAPADVLPGVSWGYVYLPGAIGIALASVIAAPYGTRLAHAISGAALKRVFAVFLYCVGASLLLL